MCSKGLLARIWIRMIIIICGDRHWSDSYTIDHYLASLPHDGTVKIVEGDCVGADKIAGILAHRHGFEVIAEKAKWEKFGNYAGPLRNNAMVHMYEPELVVAFHNDIQNSRGTKNMITVAKLCGIPTRIITSKEYEESG
jgi:hypothetical protein